MCQLMKPLGCIFLRLVHKYALKDWSCACCCVELRPATPKNTKASSSKAKPKKRKPKASAKGAPKPKAQRRNGGEEEEGAPKKTHCAVPPATGQVLKEIANASAEAGQWENKLKESNVPNPESSKSRSLDLRCVYASVTCCDPGGRA